MASPTSPNKSVTVGSDEFVGRHIGPSDQDLTKMLQGLGYPSLDKLAAAAIPSSILDTRPLSLPLALSERQALQRLAQLAAKNKVNRSYIGMGYHDCHVPTVIQRNILENPGWYTQYTPYQAEIAQGRLEALLNFQTMIADLTGLPFANASLLDEGTAAAEAMSLAFAARKNPEAKVFLISHDCHPQTIAVAKTRAEPLGIEVVVCDPLQASKDQAPFGILLQYPSTTGEIHDYRSYIATMQAAGSMVIMATDLLALCLLTPPGELGCDIAVGSAQRFGVPMGFGGPHAAFFATREEHKRRMPGRIIGVSKDASGRPALRMALQTREQHIRRDKATSNICTSQVLLAIMSSMYAVYHGPTGLKNIAGRVHRLTVLLAEGLRKIGHDVRNQFFFDTLAVRPVGVSASAILNKAWSKNINLRAIDSNTVGIAFDETTTADDVRNVLQLFAKDADLLPSFEDIGNGQAALRLPASLQRRSSFLTHAVFSEHHSETQMLRYIRRLESRDLSLTRSMIPLGSCTMKLNASSELMPISWKEWAGLHPFAPEEQTQGYRELAHELEQLLATCTGFDKVSLQPNSGAQGEYAGLLVIRAYLRGIGQSHRDICLIPKSAHGTNPASAVMAGLKVVTVECDSKGNVDVDDLAKKAAEHAANLATLMITYPSTHGVFEEDIRQICEIVHRNGGQVYMDGANLNAQIGLCRPGEFGPDVCHMNLHKTFCIPHGGGGPGMGPIAVKAHLAPYLPGHPLRDEPNRAKAIGPVSAAPLGSASILPISLMYIWMMGAHGLRKATEVAILNANYIAKTLQPHYPVLYRGRSGLVAHECIIDLRSLKAAAGIEVDDVAKRLMDYGFHAPTVSFPVPGTMMIEPTESEDLGELDRFCEAMISIRQEIQDIIDGKADRENNVLKNAPHTAESVTADIWPYAYSRQQAAFPKPWVAGNKFWPHVRRIDAAHGDRNLICTCPPTSEY